MVHKPKNNKRSRAIAARKLLKAAATAVAAQGVTESPAHQSSDGCNVSPLPCQELCGTSEAEAAAQPAPEQDAATPQPCHAEDGHRETTRSAVTQQCAANALADALRLPQGGAVAAEDLAAFTKAPSNLPTTTTDGLPSVRAVALLPRSRLSTPLAGAPGAAAAHSASSTPQPPQKYVAYHLTNTSASAGCEAPSTMWGVYACDTKACLQVVQWSSIDDGAAPTASREVLMHVDAETHCFLLSTESLVSAPHEHRSSNDSRDVAAAADSLPTSTPLTLAPDVTATSSTEAYWLVPSHLAGNFLALLQAREWLRSTAALPATGAPRCGWRVQPHPTRWVRPLHPHHRESSEAAADVHVKETSSPRRSKSKSRKAAARRAAQPAHSPAAAATEPVLEGASGQCGISPYRIPHVAALELVSHLGEKSSPGAGLPSAEVVLFMGNLLRAYPADAAL